MEPLVSVITPTYNLVDNAKTDDFYLLVNLLSKQTYPSIEHIIIDNSSKDQTGILLKDYKSKGFINFYSEPDTGRFQAFNKGIMRAKGKYVLFLNCDDFIHDIASLNDIIKLMEERDADFSFGTSYSVHPEGFVYEFVPAYFNALQVMPCALQSMVFKKSVLEKLGYFDEKFKLMSDFDLVMRLFLGRYKPLWFARNYVTCNMSSAMVSTYDRANAECRSIYIKNFRGIYNLTNEIVDDILTYSKFPADLLEKLSTYYAPEDKEAFLDACQKMSEQRIQAYNALLNNQE